MVKNIYGIFDIVLLHYVNKFETTEDADAIRSFKTDISQATEKRIPVKDFRLDKLGTFDSSTGVFTSSISTLVEAINKDKPGEV